MTQNITTNNDTDNAKLRQKRQLALWIGALVAGCALGLLHIVWLDELMTFIATIFTRLFQLVAVPTIVLAVITTLAKFGEQKDTGRIFAHAVTYTLLTTIVAAAVGLILFNVIQPGNLPAAMVTQGNSAIPKDLGSESYYDHILGVIPNNIVKPFLAFSAQLTAQVSAGIAAESLGKYIAVIVGGNLIQMVIVLPLFLIIRGLNPLHVFGRMSPAVLMAFFTKSSAATLPVTMASAEKRLGVSQKVSRFVLPICTTINMNGCAAFILVTSLFVMQNGGTTLTLAQMILWLFIAVIAAVGNAGVPMGCYFLTLSLMAGTGAPVGIMGIILPSPI